LIGSWLVLASHDNFRPFTIRSRSIVEFEGIIKNHLLQS